MTERSDTLGAIRHLGKCLREGRETYMGIPAENVCIAAADEIERLQKIEAAAKTVVETFRKDEAQGYRSRDRRYAIEMFRPYLNEQVACETCKGAGFVWSMHDNRGKIPCPRCQQQEGK